MFFKRGDAVRRERHQHRCHSAARTAHPWQARANRKYKKAMLDLEVPTQWSPEDNVKRNQVRGRRRVLGR